MRRCDTPAVRDAASNLQFTHTLKCLVSHITQSQHSSYTVAAHTLLGMVSKQRAIQFCLEHHLNALHRTFMLRDMPDDDAHLLKSGKVTKE